MKKIKIMIFIVLALCSWPVIAISDDMAKEPISIDSIVYLIVLISAVCYLHWVLGYFISPIENIPDVKKSRVLDEAKKEYGIYFKGAIGLGYFLIVLYILGYLNNDIKPPVNLINKAIFLISFGVIAKSRTIFKALCK